MSNPNSDSQGATRTFAGALPAPKQVGNTVSGAQLDATQAGASAHLPSSEPAFDVGSMLNQYRIEAKLGQGGMGAVYKALQVRLGKHVALKVLPPHLTRDAAVVARFDREMKAVGRLEHPHIVRAMDAGEVNGTHYLVMEYVEGLDLTQLVRKKGPRPVIEACELVRQAALGLAHAHENGLIHRDIKPSNLLLSKQGKLKILDLGLARLQGSGDEDGNDATAGLTLTTQGVSMGTPDYMAPEQWGNTHAADGRADLYALGCTLYYLLTGRAPYGGEQYATFVAKMKAHVIEPIPDLKAARPEVPDELAALYRHMLAKEPAERIASGAEVAKTLAGIIRALRSGVSTVQDRPAEIPTQPALATRAVGASDELQSALAAISIVTAPRRVAVQAPQAVRKRPGCLPVAVAGGLAAVLLVAGIIITIRNRDGSTTRIEVPDDAAVEVTQDGKRLGTFPEVPSADKPSPSAAASGAKSSNQPRSGESRSTTNADPQRAAALAVFEAGGKVSGFSLKGNFADATLASLPDGPIVIQTVSLAGCRGPLVQVTERLKALTSVEHFHAHGSALTDADLSQLSEMDPRGLGLSSTRVTDQSAPIISRWRRATSIDLSYAPVGDAMCQALAQLPNLCSIQLGPATMTDAGLEKLAECPHLSSASLNTCEEISSVGVAHLVSNSCLRVLKLKNCRVGDDVVDSLARAKHLRVVSLIDTDVTADGARRLQLALPQAYIHHPATGVHPEEQARARWVIEQKPSKLGSSTFALRIDNEQASPLPVDAITFSAAGPPGTEAARLANARILAALEWPNLKQADLAAEHIATIGSLIHELELPDSDLSGVGLARLAPLAQLQQLRLINSSRLDDQAMAALPKLPGLWLFELTACPIVGPGLNHLERTPNLQLLALKSTKLDSAGLAHLPPLSWLRNLSLESTSIDDAAVPHLSRYKGLRTLNLYRTKMSAAGVERLHEALPQCAILWDGGLIVPEAMRRE